MNEAAEAQAESGRAAAREHAAEPPGPRPGALPAASAKGRGGPGRGRRQGD